MGYIPFCIIFGFLAAAVLNKILRGVLRFRAEWISLFTACMLTCFVSGVAFVSAILCVEKTDEFAEPKIYGSAFILSFVAGLFAFRLIIKSESGRAPGWFVSAFTSFVLAAVPLLLQGIVSMIASEY